MGATCGVIKREKLKHPTKVLISPRVPRITTALKRPGTGQIQANMQEPAVNPAEARLGYYFMVDELGLNLLPKKKKLQLSKRLVKWGRMATYNMHKEPNANAASLTASPAKVNINDPIISSANEEDAEKGLANFIADFPKVFSRRLCKGPPAQYRWLAWKVVTKMRKQVINGLFGEELLKMNTDNIWAHSIEKDLNRTFPKHPFFCRSKFGKQGQDQLRNVLSAYSIYNAKVGYCQGMNFIIGFLLLMSTGNEEDTFWLFGALTKTNFNDSPKFDGLEGFYLEGFPLLNQFMFQFEEIFAERLPELKNHFSTIGLPNAFWLQKWFITLFLYSFPITFCVRIWDNLMVQGMSYLFKVALAILTIVEKDMLALGLDEVNDFFRDFEAGCGDGFILPDPEIIIKKANKIKISEKHLLELKEKYQNTIGKAATPTIRSIPTSQPNAQKAASAMSHSPKADSDSEDESESQLKLQVEDVRNEEEEDSALHTRRGVKVKSDKLSHMNSTDKLQKFEANIVTYNDSPDKKVTSRRSYNPLNRSKIRSLKNVTHLQKEVDNAKELKDVFKLPPIHQTRNQPMLFQTHNTTDFQTQDIDLIRSSNAFPPLSARNVDHLKKSTTGVQIQAVEEETHRPVSVRVMSNDIRYADSRNSNREMSTPGSTVRQISTHMPRLPGSAHRLRNHPGTKSLGYFQRPKTLRIDSSIENIGSKGQSTQKFTSNGVLYATMIYNHQSEKELANEIEEKIEGEEEEERDTQRRLFRIEDIDDMISENGSSWLQNDSDLPSDSMKLSKTAHPGDQGRTSIGELNSVNVLTYVKKLPI